jgi:exodeoxyribonuclease V alpha subunit
MQTKNNYDLEWKREDGTVGNGVFNGDIGFIYDIDFKEQFMEIVFEDRCVKYDFSYLEELEHAYAITVHKSQGSEYPIVIIPAYSAPHMLLTRNMLYTAVTRAQNMVIIVGREDIVKTMVDNNRQSLRYTGLARLFEV